MTALLGRRDLMARFRCGRYLSLIDFGPGHTQQSYQSPALAVMSPNCSTAGAGLSEGSNHLPGRVMVEMLNNTAAN